MDPADPLSLQDIDRDLRFNVLAEEELGKPFQRAIFRSNPRDDWALREEEGSSDAYPGRAEELRNPDLDCGS